MGFMPDATGTEGVLLRVGLPLAHRYFVLLDDMAQPNPALLDRLAGELDQLIESEVTFHTRQLVLSGIRVAPPIPAYRGVTVRALSGSERGAIMQEELGAALDPLSGVPDFVVPRQWRHFNPVALLSVTTPRSDDEVGDRSQLLSRVALAFYLSGYDIGSSGIVTGNDEPRWASVGTTQGQFPIEPKTSVVPAPTVSRAEFEAVVNLAYKTPDFGPEESSSKEIVLYRVLRGRGMQAGSFLDFAIALEAALLQGVETELAYRFSLYGALFLSDRRDAQATFQQLRRIYKVRSKLVHGAPVSAVVRHGAEAEASDLATTVAKKAIEEAWPNTKSLDELALKTGFSPHRNG
jgi:hypothetical protein